MFSALVGACAFLLAAIWETHVAPFLPGWAGLYPVWPLVVVGLSLETDRVKLACGLMLALLWEEAVRPTGTPALPWLWVPLLVLGAWSLRLLFSHRSTWSAFVLVVAGRLVWLIARIIDLSSYGPDAATWKAQAVCWGIIIAWDLLLVGVLLKAILFVSRRLGPYLPRFAPRDHL